VNKRQRSKARRSNKMRREQDRAALREQKARIVADLRARGLTHDPRFTVSALSLGYSETPPQEPREVDGIVRLHGGYRFNVARARRVVRQ
jgi:hypothetical protein